MSSISLIIKNSYLVPFLIGYKYFFYTQSSIPMSLIEHSITGRIEFIGVSSSCEKLLKTLSFMEFISLNRSN